MKYLLLVSLFLSVLGSNCRDQRPADQFLVSTELQGFLFINVSDIYHNGGQIKLLTQDKEVLLGIYNTKIVYGDSEYDLIEDEHLYRKSIEAEAFYPEYGLFVLKCIGKSDEFYEAELNNKKILIPTDSQHVEFKTLNEFILDTYPIPTESNPLKIEPNENAAIVNNYEEYTFISLEIKGDWVKVKDDKDCYSGEYPSEKEVNGWIRWRKDGKFILKVAYVC